MKLNLRRSLWIAALAAAALTSTAAEKKLVLVAGRPSHPPGAHEFRAGCLLLQKCLANVPGLTTLVYSNGWPSDAAVLDSADAVVMYADGGGGHPVLKPERMATIEGLIKKGVGFGCMHYACEVPKDKAGRQFHDWIGAFYEDRVSVNPMWVPDYQSFPNHPVCRGVKPFGVRDEWYFNLNFRPGMTDITPILVAKPSDQVRKGPYVWPAGPYPHVVAASGRDEIMMWVCESKDGKRGFGFTGGHFHDNWGNDHFRKVVLNTLVWLAKADVPVDGVASAVAADELKQNLDPKGKK
ncbi:MAG: ThuA domain-containing protein [Verrucomicrobia bacterium]|nr:ThuA domain-containing protein [Verrucomicrobiota bacterium]